MAQGSQARLHPALGYGTQFIGHLSLSDLAPIAMTSP